MNILLLLAHSIAEYDDLRMLTDLGYDVFSIGAYTRPHEPGDDLRPPLPDAPYHPELEALVGDQMAAKERLPGDLIDWADTIIAHHYPRQWIAGQWMRIKHKRVIWRTCGQSDQPLEHDMLRLRGDGLQIVRYSPREAHHFTKYGTGFAGQDALIRFGKYPADYAPWVGDLETVANVTQNMKGRGQWVGEQWYKHATAGLPTRPMGPGSEEYPGGLGKMTPEGLLHTLQHSRAYVYCGTNPAPYTLALMEAMLAGVPTVSIGPEAWMGPDALFEGHLLANYANDDPYKARDILVEILRDKDMAASMSGEIRARALELFDVAHIGQQWKEFLG